MASRAKGWMRLALGALAGVSFAGASLAQPGEVIPLPETPGARAGALAGPQCAPAKMARMVVRNISPNLQAAAPQAQPRTIYRLGSTHLRSEESPDPSRGTHNIVVVAEPDIWAFNMVSRQGQHQVDPGPDLTVHAPLTPVTPDVPALFKTLEYGCEPEFVARNAPQPARVMAWGSDKANMHVVTIGDQSLSILMHERRQAPLLVIYAKQGRPVFAVRYDEWRVDLPPRDNLFQAPPGVKFTEGAAAAPLPGPSLD